MNKFGVVWIVALLIVGLFFYFNSSPALAPKQITQDADSSPLDTNDNNNLFSISAINGTNITTSFNRTGIAQPYFCSYFALAGGGGGCHPSTPCFCRDSDNGDNPCIFGIVNWTVNQTNNIYRDSCRDNVTLDEYNCGNNGTSILNTVYRCPNGCSNGVCL